MEEVMAATTRPALLLGGDPAGPPEDNYARWAAALALPGVRGFVIGRALPYPPADPAHSWVQGQREDQEVDSRVSTWGYG
jgi:myo-inositol catabolism protein IolC